MTKCSYCGTTVLFGGTKIDRFVFCSANCSSQARLLAVAQQVPNEVVTSEARRIHSGPCPVCKQSRGPVDVHTFHKVASAIIFTRWSSTPRVSCRSCGLKAQLGATVYSLLLGWWGFPWGFLITPIQVVKNLAGALRHEHSTMPSEQLTQIVRVGIAAHAVATADKR